MKKVTYLLILFFLVFALIGCAKKNTLQVLNWGEYINEDMVAQFEDEFNANVKIDTADSNEAMYQKLMSKTTVYDIVIPSDYMIQKLHNEDWLHEIDISSMSNYSLDNFMPGVRNILVNLFDGAENYAVPYFWGSWGIIYNKKKAGLEAAVKENGLKTIFEPNLVPAGTRVGMYDVPRYAYATALIYKGMNINLTTQEGLNAAEAALSLRKFDQWATDELKHNISSNNLDLAYTWTGDFFDVLYAKQADGVSLDEMPFGIYVPEETFEYMDAMIMPKNAINVDLAQKFMNYFINPEIAYDNASIVGYTTPLIATYNRILADPESDWAKAITEYPYVPAETTIAQTFSDFENSFILEMTSMVNNVKTR
jgi:spermidine/putrescine-binding protein